jgi:hypothetical protein
MAWATSSKDVDMSALERTAHATFCPYKGECAYYRMSIGGRRSINAVWTYEAPDSGADDDVADIDIVGLLDRERHRAGDRLWLQRDLVHLLLNFRPHSRVSH